MSCSITKETNPNTQITGLVQDYTAYSAEKARIEKVAADALRSSGALGVRRYAS